MVLDPVVEQLAYHIKEGLLPIAVIKARCLVDDDQGFAALVEKLSTELKVKLINQWAAELSGGHQRACSLLNIQMSWYLKNAANSEDFKMSKRAFALSTMGKAHQGIADAETQKDLRKAELMLNAANAIGSAMAPEDLASNTKVSVDASVDIRAIMVLDGAKERMMKVIQNSKGDLDGIDDSKQQSYTRNIGNSSESNAKEIPSPSLQDLI